MGDSIQGVQGWTGSHVTRLTIAPDLAGDQMGVMLSIKDIVVLSLTEHCHPAQHSSQLQTSPA